MTWAKSRGMSTKDLFSYFEHRVLDIAKRLGKRVVLWQGALDSGNTCHPPNNSLTLRAARSNINYPGIYAGMDLPTGTMVEPWKCWSRLNTMAASNAVRKHLAVLDASCWYPHDVACLTSFPLCISSS